MAARALRFGLPLLLALLLVAAFLLWRPFDRLSEGIPPLEAVTFEHVVLDNAGIHARIRAEGSTPVRIAQVLVDDAYWRFTQTPPGALPRFASAVIDIAYPWVAGETHRVKLVTATGVTFEHEIAVAAPTPNRGAADFWLLALVGLFVGPVPVLIGLAFHPALRSLGERAMTFLLALTIGLLAFLLIDTVEEGLEAAHRALDGLSAPALFWSSLAAAALVLMLVARRSGKPPQGAALAFYVALGIGLHNFGEGLVIGASLATGAVALATFLVLGFALHNITEGIGIAAPVAGERPGGAWFLGLAAIAGVPAVLGTWIGAYAYQPHLAALCFGLGAGAIVQVIIELGLYLRQRAGGLAAPGATAAGFIVGLGLMYVTSLAIAA